MAKQKLTPEQEKYFHKYISVQAIISLKLQSCIGDIEVIGNEAPEMKQRLKQMFNYHKESMEKLEQMLINETNLFISLFPPKKYTELCTEFAWITKEFDSITEKLLIDLQK